ncbi:MAG TPA: hypothetical protein VLH37_02820 [Bacteroidales bacterium]|nr:hypothetical protein [Bacteroidales bacterium]
MKKTRKFLLAGLIALSLCMIMPGCEQESHIYDGPPVVEFSNFSWGLDPATTARPHYTWIGTGAFWAATISGVRADTSLQVQLVGPHHKDTLWLSYRVVDTVYRQIARNIIVVTRPVNADGTPMVTGTDYVVLTTNAYNTAVTPRVPMFTVRNNGRIFIAPGSSTGRLRIGLDPATIPPPVAPTNFRDIWIELLPGTVQPSQNFRIFRLRIHRTV